MTRTRAEEAAEIFRSGYPVPRQSASHSRMISASTDRPTALKLSCALGGGMAHTGNTCGAVSGALMVIGMKYGRTSPDDLASRDRSDELAQKFIREFRRRHHSVNCTELVGHDLSDPARARGGPGEEGVPYPVYEVFVRDAGEILETIL